MTRNDARRLRILAAMCAVAVAMPGLFSVGAAHAQEGGRGATQFREVERVPLLQVPEITLGTREASGWLILDTRMRRGYQIFESTSTAPGSAGGGSTVVQSFDLDTLRFRRRAVLAGIPVVAGNAATLGPDAISSGEIMHAVDEGAGRIYLAMNEFGTVANTPRLSSANGSADGKRPFNRYVMIDEKAFDDGAADFARSFREPANQAAFHNHYVMGMAVSRHFVEPGQPGRLLVTLAHPAHGLADGVPGHPFVHVVAQWDVAELEALPGHQSSNESNSQPLPVVGEQRLLEPCGRASMSNAAGVGEGGLQWGLLATASALFVVCQTAPNNGSVVEFPLGERGSLVGGAAVRSFPLAKQLADVLVDTARERILVRAVESAGNQGTTMWVFDAREGRYTGAIAVKQAHGPKVSLGLDQATGRLYALVPDHASGSFPIRGGLQISDAHLDPAPPLENIRPDMAYPGRNRIVVDPPTRRVYVRRGHTVSRTGMTYPSTTLDTPTPVEDFYRVFEDRIPVAEQPDDIDDSGFSTDVAESELTRASFQGDGSGYGARSLVIGGLDAATTQGLVTATGSACGKDDREVLAGSVGSVTLSDVTTRAEAAALDADARTRRLSPDAVDACGPRTTTRPEVNLPPTTTEDLAFDEMGPDADGDGKPDRTARNHYAATCLGEPDKVVAADEEGFTDASGNKGTAKRGREAFTATVACDQPAEKVRGAATGALSPGLTLGALSPAIGVGEPVRVAHSSSSATATRRPDGGIEVRVDSVARGIEISNGTAVVATIAVVRAEATSLATGRPGGAGGVGAEGSFSRTICGISVPGNLSIPGCINGEGEQDRTLLGALNQALGAQGRARLRDPDVELAEGSPSGYRAAVQRDRDELFEDASITKDSSLAVPGLELMFFMGDGNPTWGAGRQVVQLAGVQASTSYGITCLFGQLGNGRCAKAGESDGTGGGTGTTTTEFVEGETRTETVVEPGGTTTVSVPVKGKGESRIRTILSAPVRALQQALRLLFNNPRELGLMAAVWALLYAPCYLGERRRSVTALRSRRAAVGLGGAA